VFHIENYNSDLGNINLAFGMGKMVGSIIAGTIQKKIGKLKVLFISELWNLISISLTIIAIFYNSVWILLLSRVFTGLMCGFNTTTAPRMI